MLEVLPDLKLSSYRELWTLTPAQCINRWLHLNTESDADDISLVN